MKRVKRHFCICIAACSLFLGGCGQSLHELTVEEENLIVHYAAYAVAKHNIQQKDGMSGVYIPEAGEAEQPAINLDEETDSSQTPENTGEQVVQNQKVSMAEAIGHENDLFIVYNGSTVSDNYVEGSAYLLEPKKGNVFYIMKFAITNPIQTEVTVDHVTQTPPQFVLNHGELSINATSTLLMTDLTTYYGSIAPGQTVEVKLLFEVPESSADSITEPSLQMITDGQTKNIKF